jgi:hypothetical protein
VQICTYNAKSVELLNYHDQELTLDHLEIWKQSTLKETGAPKPKERTMTVLNLTEGLGLTEAGIKMSKGQW